MSPPSRLASLRNAFISGLFLVAPLVVTVWAFTQIIEFVGGSFRDIFFFYVPEFLRDHPSLGLVWDILATILIIGLITLLGYFSRYVLGKLFLKTGERLIESIPGVSGIYGAVKQIVSTFSSGNRQIFSKVVLVEFPRPGVWSLGFLTNRETGEVQARVGSTLWAVFVPTTPNPTSGFLVMFPAEKVTELEMSVSEGMKMIISGGSVTPPWPPK
jgi:uncharacterized membrane protein